MKTRCCSLGAALAALCLTSIASAQLSWSVYNETATAAGPASTPTSGVAVTVPAGQRATLVATNFVPIDLTTAGTEAYVTISFKVSGGLSTISGGTRAIGYGLFNSNGTATNYSDDSGYFTWLNGRNTGSLIEQRRRLGDGTSPSLLNPTGTAFNNMSTGQSSPTPGSLNDGNIYSLTIHLMSRSGAISFGNTSSNTTGGGVVLDGPGIRAITFSNPDAPASAFVFNELGFMFLNTTSATQTLTITGVTSSNNALVPINAPAIATQPAAISLNPGQAGSVAVVATGTPPLAYQWKKDGTNIAGATGATYAIASAATGDAGSYTVTITNAYGNVTSSAAAVTVTSSAIPATISRQPAAVTANVGDSATFSVSAFGSSPITYQWRKDGTAIAGATNSTLTLAKVAATDAGAYTVVVTAGTGGASTVTSSAANLSVNTAPVITTQPASVTTAAGQNVTLSVVATGSPTPSYQWLRNGQPVAGATSPTLTLNNVTLANTGVYTVSLINDVGAVTSGPAVVAIPSTMAVTAMYPANGATNVNVDVPLSLTFDQPPVVGKTGRLRIYKAADDTLVDTLDLGLTLQQRTVGTNATLYNFIPVAISGNTATFYVHAGILAYGQTYYVTLEPSAILDATGASFMGFADKTTWRFTTKAAGPAANATALTVAADGSGDFNTVQGAIDAVPAGNTQRVVITVKKGNYNELVYIGATRPFITIHGEYRAQTIVGYQDNNNLNSTTATRAAFSIAGNDTVLENITIKNPTPQGGSQAEAVFTGAQRVILNRVNLLSRQDTLLTNTGTAFITDSYIEGNTDFMWGTAAAYFQRCELKALDTGTSTQGYYTQVRNPATNHGNVYVDCRLTAADGVVGKSQYFLGRIDPSPGNFPYSECVYINCAMGAHIDPAGWLLGTNNNVTSTTINYAEYRSTDLNGGLIDVSKRISSSRQLSESEAALFRNPAFVLGGWNPQIAPSIDPLASAASAVAGSNARLTVTANGAPQPTLQWYKNGVLIPGANDYTLVLPNVQAADAGSYTVTATSANGVVTSNATTLTVTRGPLAGTYFGGISLGGSPLGAFAMFVRDDGTGAFLSTGFGTRPPIAARSIAVKADGTFAFDTGTVAVSGTISSGGAVTGTMIASGLPPGAGTAAKLGDLAGTRSDPAGASSAVAGYYRTASINTAATVSLIVGSGGQAFALAQNGATNDGGLGTVDATGNVTVKTTGGLNVTGTVAPNGASATTTFTPTGGTVINTMGGSDAASSSLRFSEFSARTRVDAANPVIVGFTLTGDAAENVLIRAIGPTLTDAFSVAGTLPNPRLDVYRGSNLVATNVGWASGSSPNDVALGAAQAGAFPLRSTAVDSALRLPLAPGSYTAVVSSATGATSGISLVEVFDTSAGAAGQRLVNLSTTGNVGTGANVLVLGLAVTGNTPKRVLIRAVGPGLAQFGVKTPLAKPALSLFNGTKLLAQNAGWSTSADSAVITSAFGEARAFPFAAASADSAVVINLGPGLYTAQVAGADGGSGTALIEVYELP